MAGGPATPPSAAMGARRWPSPDRTADHRFTFAPPRPTMHPPTLRLMDPHVSVKGLAAMRLGVGLTAIVTPSVFAYAFGRPPAEVRTPMAIMGTTFFGIRELALTGMTAGATEAEPQALRRLLLVCAATDGLDVALLGVRAIRQPALRRAVLLFGPAAALSVALHLRAAQQAGSAP